MTSIPATRRGRWHEEPAEIERPSEEALPRLPTPGPTARVILALFDEDASTLTAPIRRLLH